jgi:hypothetical protein
MDDIHATLKEQVLVCIDSSELFIYSLLVARKLHVGNATYFAENFSKADLHAGPYCFKRFKGHCHVLVVAVLMGRGFPTTIPDRNATMLHLRSKREDTSHKDGVSRQSREIICSAINSLQWSSEQYQ